MRRVGAVLVLALAISGCKSGESQEDRTIRKLKEAMKQPAPMGPLPNQTPTEHLADVAAGDQTAGTRMLSVADAQVDAGPLLYRVTSAKEQESVGEGEVKLTSDTPFVRVELSVLNSSDGTVQPDLQGASLVQGKERTGIAPDAQHLVGSRTLNPMIEPHGTKSLVLYFDAPGKQPPFVLNLPKPGGGEVPLTIQ